MGDLDFDSLHTVFDLDPKGLDGLLAELADGGEIETGLRTKPKPTAGEATGAATGPPSRPGGCKAYCAALFRISDTWVWRCFLSIRFRRSVSLKPH
jgi:hypothetical protein